MDELLIEQFVFCSGTNNARLAAMLRQLAQYHAKDPNNLFMVRLAQVCISSVRVCVCVFLNPIIVCCLQQS